MQDLITLGTAAKQLGISVKTLQAWVRNGRVPAYRMGQRFVRVRWTELLDALRRDSGAGTTRDGGRP